MKFESFLSEVGKIVERMKEDASNEAINNISEYQWEQLQYLFLDAWRRAEAAETQ